MNLLYYLFNNFILVIFHNIFSKIYIIIIILNNFQMIIITYFNIKFTI
jgi:hypothetical protein